MTVDIDYDDGNRSVKKRKQRSNQLREYYESLRDDLNNNNPDFQHLMRNEPWQWWVKYGQHKYPVLFKMATDILSIPATSCECERCFSRARRTITDDRNSVKASTIEGLQLLKNWIQKGLVESSFTAIISQVERGEGIVKNEPEETSEPDSLGVNSPIVIDD